MEDNKDNVEKITDVEIIEPKPEPKPKKKKKPNIPEDKPLTPAQEKFVQGLISGMTSFDSYLQAYPSSQKWAPSSVRVEACKLLKKPNVNKRYEMLKADYTMSMTVQSFYGRDELLNDFIYLRDEAQKSIEQFGVRQANSNAYVNALKNIGDILGLYPDKRLDINATVSNDFEINIFNDDDEAKDKHK